MIKKKTQFYYYYYIIQYFENGKKNESYETALGVRVCYTIYYTLYAYTYNKLINHKKLLLNVNWKFTGQNIWQYYGWFKSRAGYKFEWQIVFGRLFYF